MTVIVDLSGAQWHKSSYSESNSQCVEVAWLPEDLVGVRDSKNPDGPALIFAPDEWDAFTTGIHAHGPTGPTHLIRAFPMTAPNRIPN